MTLSILVSNLVSFLVSILPLPPLESPMCNFYTAWYFILSSVASGVNIAIIADFGYFVKSSIGLD